MTEPRKSLEPWLVDAVEYYPHQVDGIRKLARMKSFVLADEMGLGKSLQALTVFVIDVMRGWASTCIVVCPVTLKVNWQEELEKFTRLPFVILEGTPAQRSKQIEAYRKIEGPKVLIVNYEQVESHLSQLNEIGFDVAIADEAHFLKNPKAKRTKAFHGLHSHRSFMLSGTPFLNHVNELWSLLHRVDPAGYPSYWSFLNRYCVFGGYKDKQIVGVKNEKELVERLHAVMVRRLKKDVLNLKEPVIIQKRVSMLPEQKELYDELIEDLRMSAPGGRDDIEVDNALTKFLRLKQICGTTFTFTGTDNSAKLDQVVADAIELMDNGHKIVVFTQFRDVQEMFCRRLDAQAPQFDQWELNGSVPQSERVGVVNSWSRHDKPAALVCMLQVAGIGLNMTAARHALFIDKLFVPGLNKQAIDRLHRIGQDETQPVMVFEYVTRNTIENRVEQIVRTKSKLFDVVVETSDWKKKLVQALLEEEEDAA